MSEVAQKKPGFTPSEQSSRELLESVPDAIVITNASGEIVLANAETQRLFGYQEGELLGQSIEVLIPERFRLQHPDYRRRFFAEPRVRPKGAGKELYGLRKNDTEFPVEVMLSPVETSEGTLLSVAIHDITQKKSAEEALRASLLEKETLLREIHHRVKNNLATISSLFYLQSSYARDAHTLGLLQEAQDRVRSMALVHESLYQSGNLAAVNFGEYAKGMLDYLFQTYGLHSGQVGLHIKIDEVFLRAEVATPCGLILNELVTNCLKHAFPGGRVGEIFFSLRQLDGGRQILRVADNGIGIPSDVELKARTLGLRIVRLLTEQLDGEFEIRPTHPGTEASLSFSVEAAA